jgi:ABC-type dipeptide/oligopeptide/nickel transport system ATPase component
MTRVPAKDVLLSAQLSVRYGANHPVLRDVELEIRSGEVLGLVGQSGSGKSTLAMAILGLLSPKAKAEGNIQFQNLNLLTLKERELRAIRGRTLALVLQSPLSSLNPALRIQTQLKEAWRAHATGLRSQAEAAIRQSLESVSLPSDAAFLRKYSSQMSVGQAQRVLIAMAILHRPALLIADEPTSALDVITQSEILELFARLNRETHMSILYISHDLASVAGICQRIAILHEGRVVESGTTEQIFREPQHAYTQRLIDAMPKFPVAKVAAAGAASASNSGIP